MSTIPLSKIYLISKAAAVVDLVGTPSSKGQKGRKRKTLELVILLNSSSEEEPTPKAT
jgi:hypothetical protein